MTHTVADFDREAVERLIKHQRKMAKLGKAKPVFIIADDCMYGESCCVVFARTFSDMTHRQGFYERRAH